VCGGLYQSSGKRKRKGNNILSYKERQNRRIAKKFGSGGLTLGANDDAKVKLEKGKTTAAKPRVANSTRGRDLRAAAALARFDIKEEDTSDESESDDDIHATVKVEADLAVDINGEKLMDSQGRGMFKVCEDEARDNAEVQNELSELHDRKILKHTQLSGRKLPSAANSRENSKVKKSILLWPVMFDEDEEDSSPEKSHYTTHQTAPPNPFDANILQMKSGIDSGTMRKDIFTKRKQPWTSESNPAADLSTEGQLREPAQGLSRRAGIRSGPTKHPSIPAAICGICSMDNDPDAPTCIVCSHVLDTSLVTSIWRCNSELCKDGDYVNAGDCGICGVCGARKCSIGI
jgi:hypothetical protein